MRRTTTRRLMGVLAAVLLATAAGASLLLPRRPVEVPEAAEEILPLPPEAPQLVEDADYIRCLDRLRDDAQGAQSFAENWEATGRGGEGARHCLALALLALGEPERAAPRLEALAAQSTAGAAARAAVFGQAGQAWIAAGQPAQAHLAITRALSLTPDDADLLLDRAVAATALGRLPEALADASRVTELDTGRAEAWVVRAAALRQLDRVQEAMRDVERALSLNADDADALLERGILRQLNGDLEGARADWERAVDLVPDSGTADLARQNLAISEAGPNRR